MAEFKLGRIRFVWKDAWTTGTTYYRDDVVSFGGKVYICVIGHTAAADFFTDLDVTPPKWSLVADGLTWKGDWAPQTRYIYNDVVKYGARLYIAQTIHVSAEDSTTGLEADQSKWQIFGEGLDWKGDWSTSFDYKVNDLVKYGGSTYVCNTPHISAATNTLGLEADQSKWTAFNNGLEYKGQWAASVRYKLNDVVQFGGSIYIALTHHTSSANFASDTANWTQLVEGIQYENDWSPFKQYQQGDIVRWGGNQYIAMSVNTNVVPTSDAEIWELFTENFRFMGEWGADSATQTYKVGEVVKYGGYTYLCVQDHEGQEPPNTDYWVVLNTGLEWRGVWIDDVEYKLGDVVRYGNNTYVCVQGHISEGDDYSTETTTEPGGGAQDSRPDLDTLGTYWNILAIGTETSVLTTEGDLVYYSGSGPTRLPIGEEGQVLRVSDASIPEWAYIGVADDVYYVAEFGVDSPAPANGRSLDKPWRSIRYATEQVENGTKKPQARKLLELNRQFIQREILEWTEWQIANANVGSIWENFEYDTAKCERDMGFIVDALVWDITHGGNVRTREAALSYINDAPVVYTSQPDQTIASINYGLTVIGNVLAQTDPSVNYQTTNGDNSTAIVTQYKDTALNAEAGTLTEITSLVGIITDALEAGNANNIPPRVIRNTLIKVATGQYKEVLPIIVPAECCILGDELRSTNVQPKKTNLIPRTDVGFSYQALVRLEEIIGDIVTGTSVTPTTGNNEAQNTAWPVGETEERAAAETLARVIRRNVDFGVGDKLEKNLTKTYAMSDVNYGYFRDLILANKEFIKAEIVGYITEEYPNIFYSRTKCKQDVGYIIDALAYDLTYGGNWQSIIAGLAYFNGSSGTLQIDSTEKTATLAAYNYLKSLIETVGRNIVVSPTYQESVVQIRGTAGSNAAATTANNLIDNIRTIINLGPGSAPATVYPVTTGAPAGLQTAGATLLASSTTIENNTISFINSNFSNLDYDQAKCSRDVGLIIEAAAYDLMLETNYASIVAAYSYLRRPSLKVLNDQKAASIAAFEYARTQAIANVNSNATAIASVNNTFEFINDIIFGGSSEGNNNAIGLPNPYAAVRLLELNKDFIVSEIHAYINDYFNGTVQSITSNVFTVDSTSWMKQNLPIEFVSPDDSTNTVEDTGLVEGRVYYVKDILSATTFTVSETIGGNAVSVSDHEAGKEFTVKFGYDYSIAACTRDIVAYIDAMKWDFIYPQEYNRTYTDSVSLTLPAMYKSKLAARYYVNAVLGSQEEDMYYLRNGTGLRLQSLDGLQGDLGPANAYGTRRPTAGAYASLDPGWGPDDQRVWITARSPYVQNVTTFGHGATGQRIDGALHNGGNDSIVSNDFTQVISDGIGAHILNNGRAELVSVFTYYAHIGYLAESGGRIRATNGNNSYGTFGSVAEGVDPEETPVTAIVDNRLQYRATISNVEVDGNQVINLEFNHAGNEYTEASINIFGSGTGATVIADEFRDDAVNRVRLLDLDDSSQTLGGEGYLAVENTAQTGSTTSITLAATDGNPSNAYPGMRVLITGGAGVGQTGLIETYNSGSKFADVVRETTEVVTAGSFVIGQKYRIDTVGTTDFTAISSLTTSEPGLIFTATGVGTGTGTATRVVAGWDHLNPGTPIVATNSSSTYRIEPAVSFTAPPFSSSVVDTGAGQAFTDLKYVVSSKIYTGVASTTTSVAGSGATFDVTRNGSKYYVSVNSGGTNYARLDTLTIDGANLGGVTTTNDITVTVTAVDVNGTIISVDFDGFGLNGAYIGIGGAGTDYKYSIDGTSWLTGDIGGILPSGAIKIASGLLDDGSSTFKQSAVLAVAQSTNASQIWYSTAAYGETWTNVSHGGTAYNSEPHIAFGNNTFVVIFEGSRDVLWSSDGGVNWNIETNALPTTGYTGIAYGAGRFVAVRSGTTNAVYAASSNLASWTASTLPLSSNWTSITFGKNRFLTISSNAAKAAYSLNRGATWIEVDLPSVTANYSTVAYGQGLFMAVAGGGTAYNSVQVSEDGVNWLSKTVTATTAQTGYDLVAFGNPQRSGYWIAKEESTGDEVVRIRAGCRAKGRSDVANEKVFEIRLLEPGSGYYDADPEIAIVDPNSIFAGAFDVRRAKGAIANPTFTNRGSSYQSASAEIPVVNGGDGYADFFQTGRFIAVRRLSQRPVNGSNIVFDSLPNQVFKLVNTVSFLGDTDGTYTAFLNISPEMTTSDAPDDGDGVTIRIRYSQVRLTGHDFLDIGTGNFVNTNYPGAPLVDPDQTKETQESNGGRVFFTATDQDGNFRVGDLFSIEQATGVATLNAEAFNISGLQELSLGEVTLGGNSASISEFSTDPFFTANSDNIVPTQRAIKSYIEAQIGGGGASLNVNSVTAGDIFINTNQITTVSSSVINIKAKVNFQGGVTGLPVAYNYFLR